MVEVHLSHAYRKLEIGSRAAPKRPPDSSTEPGAASA
jgi:hypothetical protein